VLDLVCRELGCADARLEIGGLPPDDARLLWTELPNGFRLVAVFSAPPDAPQQVALRLQQLGASFSDLGVTPPSVRPEPIHDAAQRRLDDELGALASRSGASSALVIDVTSPVVWGSSEPRREHAGVEELLALAKLDSALRKHGVALAELIARPEAAETTFAGAQLTPELRRRTERALERLSTGPIRAQQTRLLEARALAELRADSAGSEASPQPIRRLYHADGYGYFARSFASIYVLVLCFDVDFSELQVEGAALHALPIIERHVLALPPIEPPPRGGKVLRLPRPER
jgi:hypothetical protein